MAIWLARLAVDRWRQAEACPEPGRRGCALGQGADAGPVALVAETAHGPRIAAANDAALAAGARPGMPLTDARALCAALRAVPSDPEGDRAFLERLALWAQRWGPWTALDEPDGLIVDVSAVAHLFGGEAALLADVDERLAAQGLAVRAAIAPTAGAAWALAHYGPDRAILDSCSSSLRGGEADAAIQGGSRSPGLLRYARNDEGIAEALAGLPVAALRLEPEALLVLRRVGL